MSAIGGFIALPGGARLPRSELRFVHSRAPGPGGQNVNKVNTRVTLLFDLRNSAALSEGQKDRIRDAYPGRISREGVLRVVSSRFRTQVGNRRAAIERFTILLIEALTPRRRRRKTAVPTRARARRLADKAHQSQRKQSRKTPRDDE
ncbi:MAG: aminoacyl-tRNA hydrolase [bacterium]|nr:aminoacyl-tRNA hydrolase [bacterium]